ncbi:MAG: DF family (seleno)protein [Bryobacteraceae bacterium]
MKVEVLFFAGCPNHKPTVERVQSVLQSDGISAQLSEIEIRDACAAEAAGFIGSPTIRVNGQDIEPASRGLKAAGFACRRYPGGLPSEQMIRAALREAYTELK